MVAAGEDKGRWEVLTLLQEGQLPHGESSPFCLSPTQDCPQGGPRCHPTPAQGGVQGPAGLRSCHLRALLEALALIPGGG